MRIFFRKQSQADMLLASYKTALLDAQDQITALYRENSKLVEHIIAITNPASYREIHRPSPAPQASSNRTYPRRPDSRPAVPEGLPEQLKQEAEAFRRQVEGARGEPPAKVAADLLNTQSPEAS